jgi:hypothetical protein
VQSRVRRSNPTTPGAFSGRSYFEPEDLSRLAHKAERALHVRTEDDVYGCGGNGCAIPTDEGDVLKITVSPNEIRAVEAVHRLKAYEGYTKILRPPVAIGRGEHGALASAYTYLREAVAVPVWFHHEREVNKLFEDIYDAVMSDDVEEYEAALDALDDLVEPLVPELAGVVRTLRKVFEGGVMLSDLSADNMGMTPSGEIVLIDAEGYAIEERTRRRPAYVANPREQLDPAQHGRFARERATQGMRIVRKEDIKRHVPYTSRDQVRLAEGDGWHLTADRYLDDKKRMLAIATHIHRGGENFETNYYAHPRFIPT